MPLIALLVAAAVEVVFNVPALASVFERCSLILAVVRASVACAGTALDTRFSVGVAIGEPVRDHRRPRLDPALIADGGLRNGAQVTKLTDLVDPQVLSNETCSLPAADARDAVASP